MAWVYKKAKSPFWQGCFYDSSSGGKVPPFSTKIPIVQKGKTEDQTKKQALKFANNEENQAKYSSDQKKYVKIKPEDILFSNCYKEFLQFKKNRKGESIADSTKDLYDRAVKEFLKAVPDKPISEYTEDDCESFEVHCDARNLAPNTQAIRCRHLHAIFEFFRKKGRVNVNPIYIIEGEHIEPEPIDRSEMEVILEYYRAKEIKWHYYFVYFTLLTGFRKSSVFLQRREQIFLDDDYLIAINKKAKGKKFIFPINPELKKLLINIGVKTQTQGPLLPEFKRIDSIRFYYRDMDKLFKKKKIKKKYNIHQLRDTFASWMANNKVDRWLLKDMLDHSTIQVTEKFYTKIKAETLRKETEKGQFNI